MKRKWLALRDSAIRWMSPSVLGASIAMRRVSNKEVSARNLAAMIFSKDCEIKQLYEKGWESEGMVLGGF